MDSAKITTNLLKITTFNPSLLFSAIKEIITKINTKHTPIFSIQTTYYQVTSEHINVISFKSQF